jgi:ABC-type Mn2+/Zn2+ transport system ATPase subunit
MQKTVSKPGITMDGVTVVRGGHTALVDVTFSVGPSTLMGVLGPNGAGKSTLFEALVGLLPLSKGTVKLHGSASEKGGVAYVPQRDRINWAFPATVQDVVTMGRCCDLRLFRRPGKRDREIVCECLQRVDMWDRRDSLVTELSGGQRQRVFIGRALAQEASVILLDEAFSGVDVGAQEGIIDVLQTLRDEGRVVMVATHDLTNVAERFDEILCVNHHVCAQGPPSVAFTPAVLEELYGPHVMEIAANHFDASQSGPE